MTLHTPTLARAGRAAKRPTPRARHSPRTARQGELGRITARRSAQPRRRRRHGRDRLDISREYPKPLTTGNVQAADMVTTMGCGGTCPLYPGKRYEDCDPPDPAGLDLAAARPIREEINRRAGQLRAPLVAAHG
jgi:hypothetical protein